MYNISVRKTVHVNEKPSLQSVWNEIFNFYISWIFYSMLVGCLFSTYQVYYWINSGL